MPVGIDAYLRPTKDQEVEGSRHSQVLDSTLVGKMAGNKRMEKHRRASNKSKERSSDEKYLYPEVLALLRGEKIKPKRTPIILLANQRWKMRPPIVGFYYPSPFDGPLFPACGLHWRQNYYGNVSPKIIKFKHLHVYANGLYLRF